MTLKKLAIGAVMISALALAGCGTDPGDRAVSGGLLSAAGTGALIGGAVGATAGATTDPSCTLALGNPMWRDHGGHEAYEQRCGHPPPD